MNRKKGNNENVFVPLHNTTGIPKNDDDNNNNNNWQNLINDE